jgi:hypothetical protein
LPFFIGLVFKLVIAWFSIQTYLPVSHSHSFLVGSSLAMFMHGISLALVSRNFCPILLILNRPFKCHLLHKVSFSSDLYPCTVSICSWIYKIIIV